MELIQIKTLKHLEVFKKEWNAILEENKNDNPFIEYVFISNWWRLKELQEKVEIYAVKEHNRIIAFFPFQVKKKRSTYVFHFIGHSDADYMDFIVKKVDLKRTIMFTLDELIRLKKSIVVSLHGLLESSSTIDSLSEYLIARNLKFRDYRIESPSFEFENTRIIIFSTNTVNAKMHRNFLWTKEWSLSTRLSKRKFEKP
ncbi:hypothetical protein PB01_14120 [Psychrobacillus glaciei]|uniref:GNAT family N-acetyltransferase n=1 Tax=Psychrobacillus glaciei TaxID=2283160 RepID=A0A5J6SQD9_9BACI|nr:hypothetical protein [Psychrobacillus glaciei]QFF99869.1 hypothetical protein PB01_14120 [Psychrobacillus glaciei]